MLLFLTSFLLGPRIAGVFWWLINPDRWSNAFSSWFWGFLGLLFLPWTTLMFVAVAPYGHVAGWDWFWLLLAFLADVGTYSSSGYAGKSRMSYA